jgi:hypothetical protein
VGDQEVDDLRRDLLGSDNEVPFVFAVLGVKNDDGKPERERF